MSAAMPEPLDPAEYGRQVRAALADLPPALLAEVLEDLDEHLIEVASESNRPLETRLGPPAEYAEQLRRAAGLPDPTAAGPAAPAGRLDHLRRAVHRFGEHAEVRSVLGFLPELRPAWWVLRAWLAVLALSNVFGYSSFLLPFGPILGIPLVAAAVVLSVRLGRRAQRRPHRDPRQRLVAVGGNTLLGLVAVAALVGAQQDARPVYADTVGPYPMYNTSGSLAHRDGSPITNIYPYTASGEPLTGVLLYDQDGRALDNVSPMTGDGVAVERVLPSGAPPPPANSYPQQQRIATDGAAPPAASATPSNTPPQPSATASASPKPSPANTTGPASTPKPSRTSP